MVSTVMAMKSYLYLTRVYFELFRSEASSAVVPLTTGMCEIANVSGIVMSQIYHIVAESAGIRLHAYHCHRISIPLVPSKREFEPSTRLIISLIALCLGIWSGSCCHDCPFVQPRSNRDSHVLHKGQYRGECQWQHAWPHHPTAIRRLKWAMRAANARHPDYVQPTTVP